MYNIFDYGQMMSDSVRMNAYAQALRQAVKPGSLVLDIGTGTGIMALLACQLGARRVYAIEPDDSINVAREIATVNGCADKIEFIQNVSTQVTLSERVDVIVSDLGGVLPFFERHIPSIVDARERFLAHGGVLIPHRHILWAAPAETPNLYNKRTSVWGDNIYGLDMRVGRRFVVNNFVRCRTARERLLMEPCCWGVLDYTALQSPNIEVELNWTATRAGTAHGIMAWANAIVGEGLEVSNDPGETERPMLHNLFFPLLAPVSVSIEDTVSLVLRANLVGDEYTWGWDTTVLSQGDPSKIKANFKQSTFFGQPFSPSSLRNISSEHVPALDEEGEIDKFILSQINGQNSLERIAMQVTPRFPKRFVDWKDALTYVSRLSQKYARQHAS